MRPFAVCECHTAHAGRAGEGGAEGARAGQPRLPRASFDAAEGARARWADAGGPQRAAAGATRTMLRAGTAHAIARAARHAPRGRGSGTVAHGARVPSARAVTAAARRRSVRRGVSSSAAASAPSDGGGAALPPLGFRFSPGAFLFPYYIGVLQALRDEELLLPSSPLAGSSAGAICVVCEAAGLRSDKLLSLCEQTFARSLEAGVVGSVEGVLRDVLERELPADVAEACAGRVGVGVTRLLPPQKLVVSDFSSKADVIEAVIASSFIPGYMRVAPFTTLRGRAHIDGYFSSFLPDLPSPAKRVVSVSCFNPTAATLLHSLRPPSLDIQPGIVERLQRDGRGAGSKMSSTAWNLTVAAVPTPSEIVPMYEAGLSDARAWAHRFKETEAV